jgi:ubiquinone/menaquinone biosynthesis C-methylase UbiE
MSNQIQERWNRIYKSREMDKLGWYEEKPIPSLNLLSMCNIDKDASILDVGCGATKFIDCLIEQGFKKIIAVDISETALNKLKERLGEEKASLVEFIVDDITQPMHINNLKNIAVWHDRALLHFLLEETQLQAYLTTLKKVVKEEGYVILATFSLKGAKICSGLDVKQYDQNMLREFLGNDFELVEYLEYTYRMPSGETRPYVYTLFQRKRQ